MSCGCEKDNKKNIKNAGDGCCPAPVIEVKSPEEVVMFHKVVVPVALGDESTYPAVKGLYKNVLMVYESNGHAYLYSSDGIPSYISFDTGGVLVVSELPEASQATVDFIYVTPSGASYITMDGETWVTLSTGESIEFNSITGRPKYAGQEMTSDTNIPSVEEETAARIAADSGLRSSLQSEINNRTAADTAISQSLSSETAARTAADTTLQNNINAEAATRAAADDSLQDQIDEVDAVASSAVQPEDIDIDVVTNLAVTPNPSTTVVALDAGKTNLMSKTSSTTNLPLPVASATQAGVMNSATFSAIAQNTQDIANIKGEVVAIPNLPANPTQQELTTAWLNTSGEPALINGAGIYDVTNEKRWTYYSNASTWYALDATGSVTVNTWTNSAAGIVKGSTTTGQIFAESDGTGSVNGWDALSSQVSTNTSKLATIANGAEVNVQSDWADTDSASDAFIKNKPTFKTVNGTSITGSGNIQTGDMLKSTYDTNNNGIVDNSEKVNNHTVEDDVPEDFFSGDATVYGTGTSITLNNTANVPLDDIKMLGDTEQAQYSGKNLFNASSIEGGYYSNTGVWYASTTSGTSDYIVATSGNKITASLSSSVHGITISEFDSNKTWLRRSLTNSVSSKTLTLGSNTAYVRVSFNYDNSTTVTSALLEQAKAQVEQGAAITTYEPYVGGTPSPSPDYPQPINVVTGAQNVTITGKNLFNTATQTTGSTLNTTTGELSTNTSYNTSDYIPVEGGATVHFVGVDATGARTYALCEYDKNKQFITGVSQYGAGITVALNASTQYVRAAYNKALTQPQLEYGSTVTPYEPYTGRTVEVNLGKNLLPQTFNSKTASGVTGEMNADGSITFTGTSTALINFWYPQTGGVVLEPGTYYFTGGILPNNCRYNITMTDNTSFNLGTTGGSFTITERKIIQTVLIQIASGVVTNFTIYPQLERGSSPSDYSPYFTPIELCKIGDYQDYIYKDNGNWYLHKETGSATFDGSEPWFSGTGSFYSLAKNNAKTTLLKLSISSTEPISTTFVNGGSGASQQGLFYIGTSNINMNYDNSNQNLSAFTTWLGNGLTKLYAPLKTATDTQITNAEVLSGLEELIDTQTPEGTTIITVDGALPAILEVTARADTVAGIEKAIDGVDDDLDRAAFIGSTVSEPDVVPFVSNALLMDNAVTKEKIDWTSVPEILSGTSAPTASTGKDGDLYVQYDA